MDMVRKRVHKMIIDMFRHDLNALLVNNSFFKFS